MSAFTKGPWIVYDDDSGNELEITCDARDGKVCIASIEIGFVKQFDYEQQANARLIASAPDLVEALAGLYADQVDYLTINKLGGMDNHWMKAARAALSKAGAL
jgi:hypothetical protein